jgi:hypothetical protein
MSDFWMGTGILALVWVVSVELRLKAAQIMGEIVWDDMHERGKAPERRRAEGSKP